jgi:hypothetical protein
MLRYFQNADSLLGLFISLKAFYRPGLQIVPAFLILGIRVLPCRHPPRMRGWITSS